MSLPPPKYAGLRFGSLVAIELESERTTRQARRWLCRCDCGATCLVSSGNLRAGKTQSCGCTKAVRISSANTRHGATATLTWNSWASMVARCTNPRNKSWGYYGGRGVTVWQGWIKNYDAFLAHIGERPSRLHTLDRIDNALGYEPGNVRWATKLEQRLNQRPNKVEPHEYAQIRWLRNEDRRPLAEIAKMFDISETHASRIAKGRHGALGPALTDEELEAMRLMYAEAA